MKKIISLVACCLTLILPLSGHSLSAGKLTQVSIINQPFEAKISLSNIGELDQSTIKVSLADQTSFDNIGTERRFILTKLKFKTVIHGNKSYILVTSHKPIQDSFLDFVIDLRWPNGRMIKPYTALIETE
jgi:pilus assembly protein FimV